MEALRQGSLPQPFVLGKAYLPQFAVAELDTLHVTVTPRGVVIEQITRDSFQQDFRTDVAVQQHALPADVSALDGLAEVVAGIIQVLHSKVLRVGASAVKYVAVANDPLFSEDHLRDQNVWSSVLTFTHRAVTG